MGLVDRMSASWEAKLHTWTQRTPNTAPLVRMVLHIYTSAVRTMFMLSVKVFVRTPYTHKWWRRPDLLAGRRSDPATRHCAHYAREGCGCGDFFLGLSAAVHIRRTQYAQYVCVFARSSLVECSRMRIKRIYGNHKPVMLCRWKIYVYDVYAGRLMHLRLNRLRVMQVLCDEHPLWYRLRNWRRWVSARTQIIVVEFRVSHTCDKCRGSWKWRRIRRGISFKSHN